MSKSQFKTAASSSRAAVPGGFGGFGSTSTASKLSYLAELPDLSSISDPNLIVAFKGLRKPDTTTKLRSLGAINAYAEEHTTVASGGVEDQVLEAWVHFYPRLSIANDRRVREASHSLQAALLKAAGKRMLKYIPRIIGTWLAGCYDKETLVSRVAQQSVETFLDTDEKVTQFWRRGQVQILEYARDAIQETPATLSDERNTASDDSMEVFHRVQCSSLSLVTNLLLKLKSEDIATCQSKYEDFFSEDKKIWSHATSPDSSHRKAACNMLIACLEKQPAIVEANLELIGKGYIASALRESQSMTALLLLQALEMLTVQHPDVWNGPFKVSKEKSSSSFDILRRFVKKGSQGCPSRYWLSLQMLASRLPPKVLPLKPDHALDFLLSLRKGIEGEPKQNHGQAWSSYFNIAAILAKNLLEVKDQNEVVKDGIVYLFDGYLEAENSVPASALAEAYYLLIPNTNLGASEKCLLEHLTEFSKTLAQRIRQSLVAKSEDADQHIQGQRQIIQMGHRWFTLLADTLSMNSSNTHVNPMVIPSRQIFITAIETIISEDGKAYSAAAIVEIVLRLTPVLLDNETESSIKTLVEDHVPRLIMSPSSRHLVSLLSVLGSLQNHLDTFENGWKATIDHLVEVRPPTSTFTVLKGLIEHNSAAKLSREHPGLQKFLLDVNTRSLQGDADAWPLVETAIRANCFANSSAPTLVQDLLRQLNPKDYVSDPESFEVALKTLECISVERPSFLHQDHDTEMELTTLLLGLVEISDEDISPRTQKIMSGIDKVRLSTGPTDTNFTLDLIRRNLELDQEDSQLLFVETLVSQAVAVKNFGGDSVAAVEFFPDSRKWSDALNSSLNLPPNPALGVRRPMAGAAFLSPSGGGALGIATDALPFSVLVRMALYTSELVDDMEIVSRLSKEVLVELLRCLVLTVEFLTDRIDLLPGGNLPEGMADYKATNDLVFSKYLFPGIIEAHKWRKGNNSEESDDMSSVVNSLCMSLMETARSGTSSAYYAAKAINHLLTRAVDAHNCSITDCEAILTESEVVLLTPKDVFSNIGILSGFNTTLAKSKVASNLCNKLVSTIADAPLESEKALGSLVLLNTALAVYDEEEDIIPVSTNRLVFAVKQILSWSDKLPGADTRLASEACHALQRLLPAIKDVYGTYWETALEFCVSIWESDKDGELSDDIIPMVGMSLKLYSVLRKMQEPNDDLQEALATNRSKLSQGLVHLLKLQRPMNHKPLDFVDTLLLRELREVSTEDLQDQSDFYIVLSSDNRKLQSAAFHVLQSGIPAVQQKLSVDVLLEKKDARLPDELLSLLLNSPSSESYSDAQLQDFPTDIRCYLLSWYLVYCSLSAASVRVQNDYAEILKSEQVIEPLLVFLFDVLGHSAGRPLDLDRVGFTKATWEYDIWDPVVDTEPERDMQWLLVNIWFMCLKYTPDLAKTWFLALKSKQTTLAVSTWTEKYFSPYLVTEAKDIASKWAEEQEASGDEKKLIVRVSKNSPNINVGYEIDELMMSIVMSLPSSYPLDRVEVKGVNRVAVKESTWNGWMRTIQGATMFNNGTVADGLTVFKKNIVAALKGQTECSICYSIISSDKRMPDKRCQTCKNLFHANCLFKWFASSNASTCPMCRQPFNYAATSVAQRARDNLAL